MSDEKPTYDPGEYGGYTPPAYGSGYQPQGYEAYPPPAAYTGYPSAQLDTPPPSGQGEVRDPKRSPWAPGRTIAVAAIVAAVVGGGVGGGVVALDHNDGKTVSSGITVTTQTAPNTAKLDGTVSAAAAKIIPSVVTISVTGQNESGTGSGVIIRDDGYILTNNHVVSVAGSGGSIEAVTSDGRSAKATVVGTDSSDDLAVIRIDLPNLVAATFAKSSSLIVGQSVVAVGAPLGLSTSVTSGIVSNVARPVETGTTNDTAVFNAIQTDAAINPGNSGGPLVDLNGAVVGVNAAIATAGSGGVTVPGQSTQSGSIGIGFAIPSDEASRIAGELIATGKATHAVIGVSVQPTTSTSTVVGAVIATVNANSPAASAGLAVGDVVTKVNNQLITQGNDLVAAIRSYAPQTKVTITYTRGGTSQTTEVTLGTAAS